MIRFLLVALALVVSSTVLAQTGPTVFAGGTIVSAKPGEAPFEGYLVVSADGRIEAVGRGAAGSVEGATVVDVKGKILVPGFVSGHNHLWQSAFRGVAADKELWGWLSGLHRTFGSHLRKGDLEAFVRHGAIDQLSHGVTTVFAHTQFSWGDTRHLYFEQLTAVEQSPGHYVFALSLDHEGSDEEVEKQLLARIAHAKGTPSVLAIAINASGMWNGGEGLKREVALAKKHGLVMQTHLLEAAESAERDRAEFTALDEAGAVFEGMTFAHFIHADAAILKRAGERKAAMIWNPLSNGRLASGLADIPATLAAGVKVGMGLDGTASADISDPFENMRMGLYGLRMRSRSASGLQPLDMIRLHTLDTARVLGVADRVGSLEPGKLADFLIVDPSSPLTGPVFNPAAHIVFSCAAANIESVWVAGKRAVHRGRVAGVDLAALSQDVARRVAAVRARAAKAPPRRR